MQYNKTVVIPVRTTT